MRNHQARISHQKGALLISAPDGKKRIPLESLDSVVIVGGAQITTHSIDACVQSGVRVSAHTQGGRIRFVVNSETNGNIHLRMALFDSVMNEGKSIKLSRAIVAAKVQNSAAVIHRWSRDANYEPEQSELEYLRQYLKARIPMLIEAETADQIRGVEGDSARAHFKAMNLVVKNAELQFSSRNRRPPRDPVNALLSFCYGLIVTECIGALESVGLDYQMGFFHRPRSGRPSLALDLVEEMRAVTDRFVVGLVRKRQFSRSDFEYTPGGGVYLNDSARTKFFKVWEEHKESELNHRIVGRSVERWALPSIQATLLARFLRGDLPDYPPFVIS